MARNQKLTKVLKGRTLVRLQNKGEELRLGFDDGSTMTVRLGDPGPNAPISGTVKAIRQRKVTLDLDFENGTTLEIVTAEPTACVMVRDKDGTLEYAD